MLSYEKGGTTCVSTKESKAWVQCRNCGHVYDIDRRVSIEDLFVTAFCPRCNHNKALNCGENKYEIPLYADRNLDRRYYL